MDGEDFFKRIRAQTTTDAEAWNVIADYFVRRANEAGVETVASDAFRTSAKVARKMAAESDGK